MKLKQLPASRTHVSTGEFQGLVAQGRKAAARNPFMPRQEQGLEIAEAQGLRARLEAGTTTMADFWVQMGWYNFSSADKANATLVQIEGEFRYVRLIRAQWEDSSVRKKAIRFLVGEALKKDPRDITVEDFVSNRLSGLISNYYSSSPYRALTHAGYEFNEWEMVKTPRDCFDSRKKGISAIKWLVEKLGKDPRDIISDDFRDNRLRDLIERYDGSVHKALRAAGYKFNKWEMAYTPNTFYRSKTNRVKAIKWLVEKLGKEPRELTQKDFRSNRLGGLLGNHYSDSPYEALREAGFVSEQDEKYMRNRTHA